MMLSDPTFWTALSFVVFCVLLGKRLIGQLTSFLDDRRARIKTDLDSLEASYQEAQAHLDHVKRDLKKAQRLTQQWLEDAKKHAHEIERSSHALMQYRRELARQNLELHIQDMRIRLLQELSHDFLQEVARKLQVHWEIEGGVSLLEGLQNIAH